MRIKPGDTVALIIGGIIVLVLVSQAFLPIITTNAEIKRQEAAEDIKERQRYQETVMEAELAEMARQAERSIATRAMVGRVVLWAAGISAVMVLVGAGFWGGKTLLRRAAELHPTKRVEDGLILVSGALYDRYSGMQTPVGIQQNPSLTHAEAYAIARGTERDRWMKLGILAIQALPVVSSVLRENGIETPREAARVLDALPAQGE